MRFDYLVEFIGLKLIDITYFEIWTKCTEKGVFRCISGKTQSPPLTESIWNARGEYYNPFLFCVSLISKLYKKAKSGFGNESC